LNNQLPIKYKDTKTKAQAWGNNVNIDTIIDSLLMKNQ
jgi:hypothetical protein